MGFEDHQEVLIGDLVEHAIGGGWGSEEAGEVDVSIIRGTDLESVAEGSLSSCPIRFETARRVKSRRLKPGDIVLEISGGNARAGQSTGRSTLITKELLESAGRPVIPASFCRLVRFKESLVDPRFMSFYLSDLHQSGRAGEYELQSSGISNFQLRYFLEAEMVRLPDLSEQRRIAWALGSLDDKIELNRKMARTLENIAMAMFKARFVDFEGVEEFEDSELGPIPKGWGVKSVSSVMEILPGGTPKTSDERYWGGGIPWIAVPDTIPGPFVLSTERTITTEALSETRIRLYDAGTVVITARGTVGNVAIMSEKMAVNQSCYALQGTDDYSSLFVFHLMKRAVDELRRGSHGSVFETITRDTFDATKAAVPPQPVAEEFDLAAQSLFAHILRLHREAGSLAALRDALLPKLISGKIRVPEGVGPEEAAAN